ncbi:hypothetical protein [Guptibacillus hwajinpoensis]|uniref:hypothetical protein n=1 Tax=Guptibacillus hwajinpoensis TaxID=208199 RepID=UPI003CD0D32F
MISHKIEALPIVDDDHHFLGTITLRQVLLSGATSPTEVFYAEVQQNGMVYVDLKEDQLVR